jgi:sulfur carrier protein ThiS
MKTVRIGQMPGKIEEYGFETGTTIAQALEIAGLSAQGYDVKVDGNKVTDLNDVTIGYSTNLIVLAKQVKGNYNVGHTPTQSTYGTRTVRVGQMPGKIEEYAVEVGTPISALLELAGLSPSGFDVKVDGDKVTDFSQPVTASTNLVVLAKQVKGN